MNPLDWDWARIARWALLGFIVMLIWLLVPVVKCSSIVFRDTPIGEVSGDVAEADKQRVQQGTSFWSRFGTGVKYCYKKTPLFGQEKWKSTLLLVFAGVALLGWTITYVERRRKRTYDRP